jgi:hypothetical protein
MLLEGLNENRGSKKDEVGKKTFAEPGHRFVKVLSWAAVWFIQEKMCLQHPFPHPYNAFFMRTTKASGSMNPIRRRS